MNKIIYRHSLSSYNLLIRLFGEGRVKLNDNYEVLLDGMVLLDDESYRLMLFNKNSKQIRRKLKSECKYLDFYSDCSKLVDYFLVCYPQFDSIDTKITETHIILKLRENNNNKNIYETRFEIESNVSTDYYITKYIKEYLDNNI